MKRNRNGSKPRQETIQVWTYDQARRVLPYVGSIMRSLREYRLQATQARLEAQRLAEQPGRPSRTTLIALQEATRAADGADASFQDSLEELHTLDIYCLDPVQGQALIPFAHGDQLAWFVFELFDSSALRFWRFHKDPLETRRPISEREKGIGESAPLIV